MHAFSVRSLAAILSALALAAILVSQHGPGRAAEPARPAKDPWVGEYRQLGGWRADKAGHVTITREDGFYRLNTEDGAHKSYRFVEEKPGVLRDEKHIYGKIFLAELKFADSDRAAQPVLKAEFCYEDFYLIRN
jgi:hypothetical protein